MLYVCLTRTSKQEYVNFCDIECHKPYTGNIYKYSYLRLLKSGVLYLNEFSGVQTFYPNIKSKEEYCKS